MTESACIPHVELPGTTRLFSDYQHSFQRVARFYAHSPWSPGCWAEAADELSYPADRRQALIDALRKRNRQSPLLEKLARPDTVAVVTGQQVGLFGGPAYTIYKALTAVRLAENISSKGIDAVPVFWLATEDHDFAEVNQSWIFDQARQPVELKAAEANGLRPVGTIPLEKAPLDELRRVLGDFPAAEDALEPVMAAYRDGRPWGDAFQDLVERLLGPHAVLFIDPLDDAVRQIAAPRLADAVREMDALIEALLARNRELEQAGYHAQVHVEPDTSLVFLLEGGRRLALRRQGDVFVSKDRRYTVAELADMGPRLSPNALLRPVIQDYLLPTVAYVGGPAELAYLAQSHVIYEELIGRMPVAFARATFTILDSHAQRAMERFGLKMSEVLEGAPALRDRIAGCLMPGDIAEEFASVGGAVSHMLGELRRKTAAFDPTLATALDKSGAKMRFQLEKMQAKVRREALRRDARAASEAAYLSGLVFPHKHLQERLYGILPFIAQFGSGFVDTLYENVNAQCPDHQILTV